MRPFKAEDESGSHYRNNWILFRACETCRHPPEENEAKTQSQSSPRLVEEVRLCTFTNVGLIHSAVCAGVHVKQARVFNEKRSNASGEGGG